MRCRQVRRRLPFYVGNDLSSKKTREIERHLLACPDCRYEHHMFAKSFAMTKEWIAEENVEWEEKEWQKAVIDSIPREKHALRRLWPWPFKPVWAYALMVLLAAAITLFVTTPSFIFKEQQLKTASASSSPWISEEASQDTVAVTFVSKETGLEINWFFNRNFNLKEEIE